MLTVYDWEELSRINPPSVNLIIDDSAEATNIVNRLLAKEKITKSDITDIIDLRQRIVSVAMRSVSIIRIAGGSEEDIKRITEDFQQIEKRLATIQQERNWMDERIYVFLQELSRVISTLYDVVTDTQTNRKMLDDDIAYEIRSNFHDALRLINEACFYQVSTGIGIKRDEIKGMFDMMQKLVLDEKHDDFRRDLRRYPYLISLDFEPSKPVEPTTTFRKMLHTGMEQDDAAVMDGKMMLIKKHLDYLGLFDKKQVSRAAYGLLLDDRMGFYKKFADTLQNIRVWAVRIEEEEIKKAKILPPKEGEEE